MNSIKVINNTTGVISYAMYAHNRLGNLRMWVDGKFYDDKTFDKTFTQLDRAEKSVKINGQWQPRQK